MMNSFTKNKTAILIGVVLILGFILFSILYGMSRELPEEIIAPAETNQLALTERQ